MNEWGMQKVMTLIVDSASSNDGGCNYVGRKMLNAKTCRANGKYLHMRCDAHIVDLIFSHVPMEVDLSVKCVQTVCVVYQKWWF